MILNLSIYHNGVSKSENFSSFDGDAKSLSPLALAFVGDSVFELLVRGNLLTKHTIPPKKLHNLSVQQVNASAQAKAYGLLVDILTDEEAEVLRRGKNSSVKVPKSSTPDEYHKATAVEALFGYLYLQNNFKRILELFELISSSETQ